MKNQRDDTQKLELFFRINPEFLRGNAPEKLKYLAVDPLGYAISISVDDRDNRGEFRPIPGRSYRCSVRYFDTPQNRVFGRARIEDPSTLEEGEWVPAPPPKETRLSFPARIAFRLNRERQYVGEANGLFVILHRQFKVEEGVEVGVLVQRREAHQKMGIAYLLDPRDGIVSDSDFDEDESTVVEDRPVVEEEVASSEEASSKKRRSRRKKKNQEAANEAS